MLRVNVEVLYRGLLCTNVRDPYEDDEIEDLKSFFSSSCYSFFSPYLAVF